jgi:formylglycine-generating enzyme required for sulfatase activity
MLLANMAWFLASSGKRVLAIDWDLEAPGLHRYFEPFLADATLTSSTGVIDFVYDYATAAVSAEPDAQSPDWYLPYANLLGHAVSVAWKFPAGGILDLVPAGRQDTAYGLRVNSFDWQRFYEKLGGGVLIEAVKQRLRGIYDFILVDSRTGVSDTAGVCTVQMPDDLIVCFTLNRQSIYGAAAVASSTYEQRKAPDGTAAIRVWPVPCRIDYSEKDRLELARTLARSRFTSMMGHMNPDDEDRYWGETEIPYSAYYAYEEILCAFGDRPRQSGSLRYKVESLLRSVTGADVFADVDESQRLAGLARFTTRSARMYLEELQLLGREYESLRQRLPSGNRRTYLMNALLGRAQTLAGTLERGRVAEELFNDNSDGGRVIGLALARGEPQRTHAEMVLQGIGSSRSAFEQYHALLLSVAVLPLLDASAVRKIRSCIQGEMGRFITEDDNSRWLIAQEVVRALDESALADWSRAPEIAEENIGTYGVRLAVCRPANSHIRYEDVVENHGPFVSTRGTHILKLPMRFRVAQHLVTNELFQQFVMAKGYERPEFWRKTSRGNPVYAAADGTPGPGGWNANGFPEGRAKHPVCGVSYDEANAFVHWCNTLLNPGTVWRWTLPAEDMWEFAARTEAGLVYPWGDAFDTAKCNSSESQIGDTSEVGRFSTGISRTGCFDMAGNLWEFVHADDTGGHSCVLRGGSYKNNLTQVRSYLRLTSVPMRHRPPDFGFRLAQVEADSQETNGTALH